MNRQSDETLTARTRDGLDNRRCNLRHATQQQNMLNRGLFKSNKSNYRGVSFDARSKKWRAAGKHDGKCYRIGDFDTPESAAVAWDAWALAVRGPMAVLNFPSKAWRHAA